MSGDISETLARRADVVLFHAREAIRLRTMSNEYAALGKPELARLLAVEADEWEARAVKAAARITDRTDERKPS